MPTRIVHVHAREVYDSRGRPTVEAEVICPNGVVGRAIAPAGASTGRAEAKELRDGGDRLGGWGVRQAVANVRGPIAERLVGRYAKDQAEIDRELRELDGTPDKSRLGANAILAVSLATAHAAAAATGQTLVEHLGRLWRDAAEPAAPKPSPQVPLPMVNMISGGLHAGGQLDVQDVLLMPIGAASFPEAMEWLVTVYQHLGRLLRQQGWEGVLVGDEGGYGPRLSSNEQALQVVVDAVQAAGYRPGVDLAIAVDVAATHFYRDGRYHLAADRRALTAAELTDLLAGWIDRYPIISLEDPLAEDDWEGWASLTAALGSKVQLIGDDLFATNAARLEQGVRSQAANAILIKLNQIGTLTETLQTLRAAREAGYQTVISARSGETEDVTIADLAVATGAGQIKIGSVARSERLAKYNQLLRWAERLPGEAYAGAAPLAHWLERPQFERKVG